MTNLFFVGKFLNEFLNKVYLYFKNYGATQLSKIYQKLGWEDDGTFLERLLRAHVLKYSAYFEDEDATEKSKEMFKDFMRNKIE